MKLQVFSVFDKKAAAFGNPFYCRTKGEAIRSLEQEVSRRDSPIAQFPQDFALFYVADWNDDLGSFVPAVGGATEVITALELVSRRDDASQ